MKKRFISILLILSMLLGILPVQAFAGVRELAGNTDAENRAILSSLSGLTGGSSDEAYALLQSLGLLDENGNLSLSQRVVLDGKSMTLSEVMALLEDPGTDLGRIAEVDGVPIVLGDLRTMIQIERELARIKETYFSGEEFTQEQLAQLQSLMGQIAGEGISTAHMDAGGTELILTITPDPGNPASVTYYGPGSKVTLRYNITLSAPPGTTSTVGAGGFSWRKTGGLMPNDFFEAGLKINWGIDGWQDVNVPQGSFTFGPDDFFKVSDITQFAATLTIHINPDSQSLGSLLGYNISGALKGFIEFYDADGLIFSDGTTQSELFTLPVTVSKPNAFEDGSTWQTSAGGSYESEMAIEAGYNEYTNPRWRVGPSGLAGLQNTAGEMYQGVKPLYQVDADLMIYDTTRSSPPTLYMKNALPVGFDAAGASPLRTIGYHWDGSEIDLNSNPLRLKEGYSSPFIYFNNTPGGEWNSVSIVMEAHESGAAPQTLRTVWPGNPIFCNDLADTTNTADFPPPDEGPYPVQGQGPKQRTVSSTVSVYDDRSRPEIASIEIPAGTYTVGQYVPITLTFSEPVKANGLSLNINGSVVTASGLLMDTTGRKAVALYRVKDVDATTINISSVANLEDLMGNTTATATGGGSGWSFPGVVLDSTLMKNAVTAVSADPATVQPADLAAGVTVTLALNQDPAYRTKYADYNNIKGKAPFAVRLTNQATYESLTLDTALTESGGVLSATAQTGALAPSSADATYLVEVIAYEGASDTAGTLVREKSAAFTVKAVTFVDGVSVVYPAEDKAELSLGDTYRTKLDVSFAGNPTYKTGAWSSSNEAIATIAATGTEGQVVLTGAAVGKVTFTFTADDGGLIDPDDSHNKSCASKEYTVVAGSSPALVVPAEANRIVARRNGPAQVRWSSNSSFFTPDDFVFTVQVFEGNLTEAQLSGKAPVYTGTADKTSSSLIIPENTLSLLYANGLPAYTVRISMPHPKLASETLSALCYIVVNPDVAVARLTRPAGGLYLLDSEAAEIGWVIDNYTDGHTTGELRIERIRTENGADVKETVVGQPVSSQTGGYTLTPAPVAGLKDTYMVTLRAKNTAQEGYSSDSFPLYVYNADALRLEVDGQKVTSLTLDNESVVSGSLPTDTGRILKLREELALIEYIGINYNDYGWSQLKDGIRWTTSDTNTVSVNYRQGGIYEDLSRFSMDAYLPETKMALSSVTDGSAVITATHANTGMSASVTVDVRTLWEKFYLFQLTPMQATELSYTDGRGVGKTVHTNDEGVLALYEPEGIASDVHLRAMEGGNIWLGTIYQKSLLSGERDATRLQLYPLNTLKLRQAAKAEIYLKKPDGSPYTGSLTLRGGVYKNGGYCQDAKLLGNTLPDPSHPLKDGKDGQTVAIGGDGKLTVYMDSTQFWSAEKGEDNTAGTSLKPTDSLQYIFELTGISGYYPLLIYANGNLTLGDLLRSAESVVSLESHTGPQRPFLSNQTLDYGLSGGRLIDVRGSTEHIGPNGTYPEVKLLTTVLLWGQDAPVSGYRLELCDEYGYVPAAQSSLPVRYPFSSISLVRNTLTLSKATVTGSGWIAGGRDAGLKARLSRAGTMLAELPVSPRVTDLTQAPKLTESDNITGMMLELQSKSGVGSGAEMSDGNKIVNGLMELMGKVSGPVNGSSFKMLITPGKGNAVFNAFIWAGYNSLGLDEVDYDQNGLALDYKLAEQNLTAAPNLNDLTDMAKGSYDPGKTLDDAMTNQQNGKGNSSTDFGGQLEGYFEAQIQYNFQKGKWEIYVLGGGFTVGFGMSYTYSINAQAGPVPLTATFNVGGALQLDFKAAVRYAETAGLEWASTVTGSSVNDYLTTLRINAYVNAFGGLGFDYSVLALKIGLFGKITFDNQNKFLSRTYLEDPAKRQLNGQALQLTGEVGIKFVAQFLFITYELVLASGSLSYTHKFNSWDAIDDYWKNTGSGLRMSSLMAGASGSGLAPVSSTATLQSREYLDRYARSWGSGGRMSLFSLDPVNALEPLQTNAYPYSLPLVTDDGQLLLYAFDAGSADVADTRVYATRLTGGSYPQGVEIAAPSGFDGCGDSGLSLAGDGSFAAAAWVRQSASLPGKSAGQTLTREEQALLMNGTEVVASIYSGTGWTSTRLTHNASPDLAPAAAANGSRAIVAWRSVYAGDADDLLSFSQQDYILYSIFDGVGWSAPKQLYNGTSGAVKGIHAAMLEDGTAAVAYTLDIDTADGRATDYEIGYTVVNAAGEPSFGAIITQDSWLDENPQIAAVQFAPDDERFVLGWHSLRGGIGDIRLAAIDGEGALSNSFIESIAQAAGGSTVDVGGSFRFARMSASLNELDNLSILWTENRANDEGEPDHGILRAVKLIRDGGGTRISAALDVAELPPRTLPEHFDAYVAGGDGKTVKAVLQGTEYKEIHDGDPGTYTEYDLGDGRSLRLPREEVKLFTATAAYENKARLLALAADYASLSLNTLTPIQFTVFNAGLDVMDRVSVQLKGRTTTFDSLDLYPNESKTLTCWYPVGGRIENLDYTLTAHFGAAADTLDGKVYLDYPDVGLSQMKVTSEDRGIRTLQLTLYNGAAATLSGGKNRSVRLGFYDDALFESIQGVTCSTPGVTVGADKVLTISGEDALGLIDEGAFTLEVSFDVGRYVTDAGLEEIPDSGVRLYADAWAEETSAKGTAVLPEYSKSNNSGSVLFESGLARSGQLVGISVEQGLAGDSKTTASVSLRNNSLRSRVSGNLVVSLLDGAGNVLERQQTYTGSSGSLIALDGEETESRAFTFGQSGSRVTAAYGDLTLASGNARLAALSFEGLAVRLSDFAPDGEGRYVCTAPDTTLSSTLVSFMPEDPGAAVTVNGAPADGSARVSLPAGRSEITLEVTAQDGAAKQRYILSVNRNASPESPTPETQDYRAIVKTDGGVESTLPVTVNENTRTASIDLSSPGIPWGGTVVTVPPITGIDTWSIGIPVSRLSAPDARGILTVNTDAGSINLPSDMLTGVSGSGASKAEITIGQGNKGSLPDAVKAAVGSRPLIRLVLTIDGKQTDGSNPSAPVTVRIPYRPTPEELANPESIILWHINGSGNAVTIPNGHYDAATGTVVFTTTHFGDYAVAYHKVSFNDVPAGAWYFDAVGFIAARGITTGTGGGNYSPGAKLTRGEFIVLMMRAYGIAPDENPADNFADSDNTYYTGYLAAAKRLHITTGVGDNLYAPGREITRQEMFTLLYNALKAIGRLPQGDSGRTFSDFPDAGQIDVWAKEAMTLLVKTGTIGGLDGRLVPLGTTTRAEMAQVLHNLLGK